MTLSEFRVRLLQAITLHLPAARVRVQEQRSIVLKVRAQVEDDLFLDVYFNELTGKTSYTLVHKEQRVLGYDNYQFWHCHPYGRPADHVACEEPEIEVVLAEVGEVAEQLQGWASLGGDDERI
jgi:hypothetical protein